MTAKKLLLAIVTSRHQKQVPEMRTNIDYFIFNPVIRFYSDVKEFASLVGSNVDPGISSTDGFANPHSRSHASKHGF
jgi:hypothetical protein